MLGDNSTKQVENLFSKATGEPCKLTITRVNEYVYNYHVKSTEDSTMARLTISYYPNCCGLLVFSYLDFPYYRGDKGNYLSLTKEKKKKVLELFVSMSKTYIGKSQIQYAAVDGLQENVISLLESVGFKGLKESSFVNRNSGNTITTYYYNVFSKEDEEDAIVNLEEDEDYDENEGL